MKKLLLTVAIAFSVASINAQDLKSKKGENYLPVAGDWAIGFNANNIFSYLGNSFNGNTNNNAPSVDYLRQGTFVGKKFLTDKNALRVIANFKFGTSSVSTPNVLTSGSTTTTTTTKVTNPGFDLTAGLGKEWRKGSTRLQGFYGADAFVNISSGKTKTEVTTDVVTTTGSSSTVTNYNTTTENKNGLGLGLGVQGFIGAEYFLFPKISIGAQYTWGLNVRINGKSSSSTTTSGTGIPSTTTSADGSNSSNFGLGGVGVSSLNLTLHF